MPTSDDILPLKKVKKSESWGATCKFSRGNRKLPNSPIPLAPHLAREWNCWEESDDSGDEEEEVNFRSVVQCQLKIAPKKSTPKSAVIRKKRETPSSPLLIRSLSVGSSPASPFKSNSKISSPDLEMSSSPVAKHGFRTIFSAKRANRATQYQWVQSNDRTSYGSTYRTYRSRDENDISNLRIASSPALTPQQHPTFRGNPNINPGPGNQAITPGNPNINPSNQAITSGKPNINPSNQAITPGNPGITPSSLASLDCGLKNGNFSQIAAQQFSNRPKTSSSHLNLKPASFQTLQVDFHRPITSHMTGRALLKGYFLPRKSDSSLSKQKEMLQVCIKTEAIKRSSDPLRGSSRAQVPEPPAPSPLVPH
ncbi:hypothetical protein ACHWQZ_G009605 [Mnemiopsis leidyi]